MCFRVFASAQQAMPVPCRVRMSRTCHYADAVACTCRWLLGATTRRPVTKD
jgi:hypothetical protein